MLAAGCGWGRYTTPANHPQPGQAPGGVRVVPRLGIAGPPTGQYRLGWVVAQVRDWPQMVEVAAVLLSAKRPQPGLLGLPATLRRNLRRIGVPPDKANRIADNWARRFYPSSLADSKAMPRKCPVGGTPASLVCVRLDGRKQVSPGNWLPPGDQNVGGIRLCPTPPGCSVCRCC